jgi:hypothetical protein
MYVLKGELSLRVFRTAQICIDLCYVQRNVQEASTLISVGLIFSLKSKQYQAETYSIYLVQRLIIIIITTNNSNSN